MLNLNLSNKEKSDIQFEVYNFPDGQRQVKIIAPARALYPSDDTPVLISSRMNNFQDLELIICAVKSLKVLNYKNLHLFCPFFLGSRSDRNFEVGTNNYLKEVICPIVNSLKFDSVTVMDPHSDVLEACLNNYYKVDNFDLINFALKDLNLEDFVLISPDAGATKKIYSIANKLSYSGEIITCSKTRDEHGKLSNLYIPLNYEHVCKEMLIIDDICDGGATFINIGKAIFEYRKATGAEVKTFGKLHLIVTHGIFSKGYIDLSRYFDNIYSTNSYCDVHKAFVNAYNVKQLDIF